MFGQMPELRLDIVCNINGEKKTFQQVPSNSAIADFGDKAFVIADEPCQRPVLIKKIIGLGE